MASSHQIDSTEISVGNKFMTAKKSGQASYTPASLTPGDRATPNNLFGYSGGTFSPEFKEEQTRVSGMD